MNKKETTCGNGSEALRNPYYAYRHRCMQFGQGCRTWTRHRTFI